VSSAVRAREPYVVVEIHDGVADTTVGHLPAPWRERRVGGERVYHELFDQRVADGTTPDAWPAACGVTGPVYTAAGALDGIEICRACKSARSSRLIAEGLRVDACAQCGSAFEQKQGRRGRPLELCPSCRGKVKETIAEKQRAYYEANRQTLAEKQRAYREANRQTLIKVEIAPKLTARQELAWGFVRERDGVSADEVGAYLHAHRERRPHGVDERCEWCARDGRSVLQSKALKPLVTYRRTDQGRLYVVRDPKDQVRDGEPAAEPRTCPACNGELTVNGQTCPTCHGNPFWGL
jgi:hypothetical protein